MVTRVKFHEKAVFIYALEQLDENTPVISDGTLAGTVAISSDATYANNDTTYTLTGTGTSFLTKVTPGCYLRLGYNNLLLGQVATVTSDTSLTIYNKTIPGGAGSKISAFTGKKIFTILGPNNAIPALNLNFSVDLTTEAFQYTGDELDRDEITVITDKIGKFDFESFIPMVNLDTIASVTSLPYLGFFRACGFNVTSLSTPELGISSARTLKISNATTTNKFLSIEVRRASPDDTLFDKVYRLSNVRGTVDTDITVGTKGKLKWNMQGNFDSVVSVKKITSTESDELRIKTLKSNISSNINSDTMSSSSLVNLVAPQHKLSITGSATDDAPSMSITLGSETLAFTAGTGTTGKVTKGDLITYLSNLTAGTTAADLNEIYDLTTSTGLFNTTTAFSSQYAARLDTTTALSVWFTAIAGSFGTSVVSVSGTGVTKSSSTISNVAYSTDKTFCFDKLSIPNSAGFEFTRYKTGCLDGWSKGATPTDVTLTIVEDGAGASLNPHNHLGDNFNLWFGFKSGEGSVKINLDKLQLTNVTSSKVATFMGQDLTLRNIGNTSIYITGLTS